METRKQGDKMGEQEKKNYKLTYHLLQPTS